MCRDLMLAIQLLVANVLVPSLHLACPPSNLNSQHPILNILLSTLCELMLAIQLLVVNVLVRRHVCPFPPCHSIAYP